MDREICLCRGWWFRSGVFPSVNENEIGDITLVHLEDSVEFSCSIQEKRVQDRLTVDRLEQN